MRYMLMLIDEEPSWEDISPQEMQATMDAMGKFNDELQEAGALVDGAGLRERATATTVRFAPGGESVVSDGPFAETKEQLMGYWIIETESLDEALGWTRKVPLEHGAIEIRPMVESGDPDEELTGEDLLERVTDRGPAEAS